MQEKEENITKIVDRLKEYLELKGITFNKLSIAIGVSNSYFSKMKKDRKSFGSEILKNIFLYFEDLNPNWLITGRGSMELGADNAAMQSKQEKVLLRLIDLKDTEIRTLNREVGALRQEIENLKQRQTSTVKKFFETELPQTFVADSEEEYKSKKKQ